MKSPCSLLACILTGSLAAPLLARAAGAPPRLVGVKIGNWVRPAWCSAALTPSTHCVGTRSPKAGRGVTNQPPLPGTPLPVVGRGAGGEGRRLAEHPPVCFQPTPRPQRPHSPLAGVAALDKPVTLTETKIPLGELVQKVAADTGVKLVASPEVADEPVAVVVKDLPARELLEQVAELLDYLWSKRGKPGEERYEIWQDLAAKNREEAARQAARTAVEKRLNEEVHQFAEVAALPESQIQEMAEQYRRWLERFFALPPPQRGAVRAKEWTQVRRLSIARRLGSSVDRTLALLLGRLSPQQWGLLRQGRSLLLSSEPGEGEMPLPEATARAFRSARPSMDSGWRFGDEEATQRQRDRQREMEAEWAAASGYRVAVRLDTERFQRQALLTLRAHAAPLRAAAPVNIFPGSDYSEAEGTSIQLSFDPTDLEPEPDRATPERRAALEKDPLLGAVKRFQRQPKPRSLAGARPEQSAALHSLLPDLAWSCGVDLIADSYAADRTFFPVPAAEPTPLYDLLDQMTQYGYRWDRKGRLIRIRYRAWPFARGREVPLRVVRRWNERLAIGGEVPLEECTTTAAELGDEQLEALPEAVRGSDSFFVHRIYAARHALRLYASLTPLQRQTLWHGQPFLVAAMSPAQRALFLAPWQERQQRDREQLTPLPPTPPPLGPESRFSLTSEALVRIVEREGDRTLIQEEPAPLASGTSAGTAAATPSSAPRPGGPSGATGAAVPNAGGPSRLPVARIAFRFLYSPEVQESIELEVAPPPEAVRHGRGETAVPGAKEVPP
jgi:hypothetical protein